MDLQSGCSPTESRRRVALAIAEKRRRFERTKLLRYQPYPKQIEFHRQGAHVRERMFMAGNQLGKTYSGAAECAVHLTGQYPSWWQGRRWDRPVRAWVGSDGLKAVRDGAQRLLIGEPSDEAQWGTGLIPGATLIDRSRGMGLADLLDSVIVKHVSGGRSLLSFKSYDQGRPKWQGETLDFVWFDEEPPMDIYMEGLTRTNATGGMAYLTFTPLLGMSDVVVMFLHEAGVL